MKIAVLINEQNFRKYTTSEHLSADYELMFFGNGSPDEDAVAASGAEMILADAVLPITASLIERMPKLRLIQSQGVGYNRIDIKAAREAGVDVANCACANTNAVAEQTIMLMLAVLKNIKEFDRAVYDGQQISAKNRCFSKGLKELRDCHVGIVGFGAVGRRTAELLRAFGSRVSYYNRTPKPDCGFEACSFDKILSDCDIVSLHLAAAPETVGIIGAEALSGMKQGSILINTARGELVDQNALCESLLSGRLAGAGLDVLSPEPVTADNPVLNLPADVRDRVVLSPHIGGLTEGFFRNSFDIIWENARRLNAGEEPINVVNR